jgi:hypothetical protein
VRPPAPSVGRPKREATNQATNRATARSPRPPRPTIAVVFKGKWHLVKATGNLTDAKRGWVPEDVNQYGWTRWNPADAGANQDLDEGAAGDCADTTCNDLRFMTADGDAAAGDEGALPYLTKVASPKKPFFLVISLVNPHDVLFYPNTWEAAGYPATDLVGDIKVRTAPALGESFAPPQKRGATNQPLAARNSPRAAPRDRCRRPTTRTSGPSPRSRACSSPR